MGCSLGLEYCILHRSCSDCNYNDTPYVPPTLTKEQEEENRRLAVLRNKLNRRRQERFMSNVLPNAVVPIIGHSDGCGFFTDKYFITAGHCLDNGPISICVDGQIYAFSKDDALILKTIDKANEKHQTGDIAIFKFNNQRYSLRINLRGIDLFDISNRFILPHYVHSSEQGENDSIFSGSKELYKFEVDTFFSPMSILEKTDYNSNSYVSHFFEAITESSLKEGSSGSPLLNAKNEVVGILVGCLDPENKPNTILFQQICSMDMELGLSW